LFANETIECGFGWLQDTLGFQKCLNVCLQGCGLLQSAGFLKDKLR
jgi:hypothetical protein